jgi:hypothetical protein
VDISGGLSLGCGTATIVVTTTAFLPYMTGQPLPETGLLRFVVGVNQELGAWQSFVEVVNVVTPASAVRTMVGIVSIKSVGEFDWAIRGWRTGNVRLETSFETCRTGIEEFGLGRYELSCNG